MSRRTFRLEAVLRVRRAQEETARAVLSRENARLVQAKAQRERCARRYRELPVSAGAVSESVFRREAATSDLAAATLLEANDALSLAEAEAAVALRAWRDAAQRVQALERLEARRLEEVLAEEARHETMTTDELVTSRYIASGQGTP
jgi:flagellar export protein FliJ